MAEQTHEFQGKQQHLLKLICNLKAHIRPRPTYAIKDYKTSMRLKLGGCFQAVRRDSFIESTLRIKHLGTDSTLGYDSPTERLLSSEDLVADEMSR
ncbi:hypothetical protein EVAR_70605_1 [Eumeta japonica]|uniref:Uncharacterized protein n=1 Tax=Eumeta variegata TaxID=151549 RepID=A0A4C1TDE5_EUMVA|nr:hypothetical protein EVAR_70605_1 [Eumeta japonica]